MKKDNAKRKRAYLFLALASFAIILLSVSLASAVFWSCFNKGQTINYCNPAVQDRTCTTTLCKYCMSTFNSTSSCYNQGNWVSCNGLPASEQDCSSGSGGVDSSPPTINLISPQENQIFTERSVPFSFTLNEKSDVYYLDNINGRGRWSRVCSGCSSINQKRSFAEGFNDLTLRAKDSMGNLAYKDFKFFVDSKKPRINKAEPKKGFASSAFYVQFTEANPKDLMLHYGNSESGFNEKTLNIESDCARGTRDKYDCSTQVDLENYDGEIMEYWFHLTDIANSEAESKHQFLTVDTTFPVVESMTYTVTGNKVLFVTRVTEQNFADVSYIDQSELRPRWRKMCSKLTNFICEKTLTLRSGTHDLTVQVNDKAGNSVGEAIFISIP